MTEAIVCTAKWPYQALNKQSRPVINGRRKMSAEDFYKLNFGIKNKDLEDTRSQEYNTSLERHWLLDDAWYRTASVRWLYEDYVQGTDSGSANLIMPGISFSRSWDSGGSMPSEATRYLIGTEVSDPAWGSDSSFVRVRSRVGWIGSFSDDQRYLVRCRCRCCADGSHH